MKQARMIGLIAAGSLPLASCGSADTQPTSQSARSYDSVATQSVDSRSPTAVPNNGTVDLQLVPGSMPLSAFWQIMNAPASIHEYEVEAQEQALAAELRKLSDEDLVAFKMTYDQVMNEAYTWDLWAAAYFVCGGCSDDGFTYFRNWLIGRGEHAFFNAMQDPDSLAIFDMDGEFDIAMSCEWDLLPSMVWDQRHAHGPDFYDQLPDRPYKSDPSGEEFDEDDFEAMKARFPKLAKVIDE